MQLADVHAVIHGHINVTEGNDSASFVGFVLPPTLKKCHDALRRAYIEAAASRKELAALRDEVAVLRPAADELNARNRQLAINASQPRKPRDFVKKQS